MSPDEALKYEYFGIAEPALAALKAEVLRLREAIVDWRCSDTNLKDEVEALKATLTWYATWKQEMEFVALKTYATTPPMRRHMATWEEENPKPSEGT